ncbi:MAG: hypothetical protein E7041_00285 [Lentisphaerae bacterium]|nr:hypothetical protein [Lentisphaerota bacterium]
MMNIRSFATVFAVFSTFALAANIMPDPEARAYLKELAKSSASYQRRADRTSFFSRAQLKYGLERSDYLRRWCDRPLMQDTTFAKAGTFTVSNTGVFSAKNFINHKSYKVESHLLKKFNFDGFAFFPETFGRVDLFNHVGTPGTGDIKVLTELRPLYYDKERRTQIMSIAVKNPRTFRLNGKIVITSYPGSNEKLIPNWVKAKKELTDAFGDQFIVMPWLTLDGGIKPTGKNKCWSVADIRKMQERLRFYLRHLDGFYYNAPPFDNRRYHWDFDREVAIPIIHSVMNEPEFRNKYLGWGTKVGHMNCHIQPFGMDAFCTDTLRGTVGAALLAKADFVNCVEWDEENENTCFRPMTVTGFSTLRICRAFEQLANGGKFSPLADDDLSIPNLILSYPRVVAAGQLVELEIVNVPDSNDKDTVKVAVALRDNDGKTVWQSPEKVMQKGEISTQLFPVPSETLAKYRFLNPVMTVDGKTFDRSFYPIEIRAWWHWDYLYAKHCLRDMPENTTAEITYSKPDKHGLIQAQVNVSSPTALRSIEIMTGDNLVVYSHDAKGAQFRETADTAAFRITLQASPKSNLMITGSVRFLNAPGLKATSGRAAFSGTADNWVMNEFNLHHRPVHRYISIPRRELANAVMEVDLPGLTKQKTVIRLADVQKLGSIGVGGDHSSNLVIARNNQQMAMPEPLGGKEYTFTVPLRPDSFDAAFMVQTVDEKFRIHRSKKTTPLKLSGKMGKINVYSMAKKQHASAEVDVDSLRPLAYDFSALRGSVLTSTYGTSMDGILSGYVPQTTGFGQGETLYGNGMKKFFKKIKVGELADSVPEREVIDGKNVLVFKGGQYVSLPMGIIPPFAGYEISMDVYVTKDGGKIQTLLTDSREGFTLQLRNRVPVALFYCNNLIGIESALKMATGIRLRPWTWNRIVVKFDQKKMVINVNGVDGEPVSFSGYNRYPRATTLGASERGEFFTGKIRDFVITPR